MQIMCKIKHWWNEKTKFEFKSEKENYLIKALEVNLHPARCAANATTASWNAAHPVSWHSEMICHTAWDRPTNCTPLRFLVDENALQRLMQSQWKHVMSYCCAVHFWQISNNLNSPRCWGQDIAAADVNDSIGEQHVPVSLHCKK